MARRTALLLLCFNLFCLLGAAASSIVVFRDLPGDVLTAERLGQTATRLASQSHLSASQGRTAIYEILTANESYIGSLLGVIKGQRTMLISMAAGWGFALVINSFYLLPSARQASRGATGQSDR